MDGKMKKIILAIIIFMTFNVVKAETLKEVFFYKCVDGDTISVKMDGVAVTVRMLAIDTSETVKKGMKVEPWGKEASNFTCEMIKSAKTIHLELDKNADLKDKYNRYLAWVFVDNKLLQRDLIDKGYARVAYLYNDYKYTDSLVQAERQAKREKVGMWGEYKESYIEKLFNFLERIIDIIIEFIQKVINIIERDIKSLF